MRKSIQSLYAVARRSAIRRLWRNLPARPRKIVADWVFGFLGFDYGTDASTPRIYPTLQCNLTCPYCSDGIYYDKSRMGYTLLSADQWVGIIDSLPGNSVIFTGGEPTLHPGLPEIINRIKQQHVMLYTNLAYDTKRFFDQLTKPITVYASFHPNNRRCTPEFMIGQVQTVLGHPMCRRLMDIHSIQTPENGDLKAHRKLFAEHGVQLVLDDNQFENNRNTPAACNGKTTRTVHCRLDRVLIGPHGQRRICVSKLVRSAADGIVPLHGTQAPEMICHEFGRCSPCDEVAEITDIESDFSDPASLVEMDGAKPS